MRLNRWFALVPAAVVLLAVVSAVPASAQFRLNDYKYDGPLHWLPDDHDAWPRFASDWLPKDSCATASVSRLGFNYKDPYRTVVRDIHDQSCPGGWNYVLWRHRTTVADARDKEYGKGTSFDHNDLDPRSGQRFNVWHWELNGMPESQRCYPAGPEWTYGAKHHLGRAAQPGYGGLQISQHLGEWHEGRQYLPDYFRGIVRANRRSAPQPRSAAPLNVVRFGAYDFDVYSRPKSSQRVSNGFRFARDGESCAAVALYNLNRMGAGGRTSEAEACAASSMVLLMRANSEMRCEPDLSLYESTQYGVHPYAKDFRDLLVLEYQDPPEEPTRADHWFPPPMPGPDGFFGYPAKIDHADLGEIVIRELLTWAGSTVPFRPEFPHNWDNECSEERAITLGCGPSPGNRRPGIDAFTTEYERQRGVRADQHPQKDRTRLIFGSRPLFRRIEVAVSMPGESMEEHSTPRSFPETWKTGFTGYLTEDPNQSPTQVMNRRAAEVQRDRDPAPYGTSAWLAARLSHGDPGGDRELGIDSIEVADTLEASGAAAADPSTPAAPPTISPLAVTDCLRFIPTELPITDTEAAAGAEVSQFWNNPEWRECAQRTFTGDAGGSARLSAGTTGTTTWLRHQGGDDDVKREVETANTNLDAQGYATENGVQIGSSPGPGAVEVPLTNQARLNTALGAGFSRATHTWYRTAGTELGCIWGGYVPTDLPRAAANMESKAWAEVRVRVEKLEGIRRELAMEHDSTVRPDVQTCQRTETGTPYVINSGCVSDGVGFTLTGTPWTRYNTTQTCSCLSDIPYGGQEVTDCPTTKWRRHVNICSINRFPACQAGRNETFFVTFRQGGNSSCFPNPPSGRTTCVSTTRTTSGVSRSYSEYNTSACDIPPPEPPEPPEPPALCSSACGAWTACSNGVQTRTCTLQHCPVQQSCTNTIGDGRCTWEVGPWSSCVNGRKRRRVVKKEPPGGCAFTDPEPARTTRDGCGVTPPPSCTWLVGAWKGCVNGTDRRDVRSSRAGCTPSGDRPASSRTCTVTPPSCSWTTGGWGKCVGGTRRRSVSSDRPGCIPSGTKPAESETCSSEPCVTRNCYALAGVQCEVVATTTCEAPDHCPTGTLDRTDICGSLPGVGFVPGNTRTPGSAPGAPAFPSFARSSAVARVSSASSPISADPLPAFGPQRPGTLFDALRRTLDVAAEAADAEPAGGAEMRTGVRAMQDGIVLARAVSAQRTVDAFENPAGEFVDDEILFAPVERREGRTSFAAALSEFAGPDPDFDRSAPARVGVWAAAEAGNDAAAGGWYGWSVGGQACGGGAACSQLMAQHLVPYTKKEDTVGFWDACNERDPAGDGHVDPPQDCSDCRDGFIGPWCLNDLYRFRDETRDLIELWSKTMMGWHAVGNYRRTVRAQIAGAISPYMDWSSTLSPLTAGASPGTLQHVSAASYVTSLSDTSTMNPVCLTPRADNPLPVHTILPGPDRVYGSDNTTHVAGLWDRASGTVELSHGATRTAPWPPTAALKTIPIRSSAAAIPRDPGDPVVVKACVDVPAGERPEVCGKAWTEVPGGRPRGEYSTTVSHFIQLVPGSAVGGESGVWREVFYGSEPSDTGYDPESPARYSITTASEITDPDVRARLPRTMRETGDEHITDLSLRRSTVTFREFSCPAADERGQIATVRPVVCRDGKVFWGLLEADHMTACGAVDAPDCAYRVYGEPVLNLGGRGFDPLRSNVSTTSGGTTTPNESLVSRFGPDYRHVCTLTAGQTTPPTITDGRVGLNGSVYRLQNEQWVPGAGRGSGGVHGHDPDEGFYPRVGTYQDQDGVLRVFPGYAEQKDGGEHVESFPSYDNYGEIESVGDLGGSDERLTRDDGMFPEHQDEVRMLDAEGRERYDEFVTTPYEASGRATDFTLWRALRTETTLPPPGSGAGTVPAFHLFWGWPSLDQHRASEFQKLAVLPVRRLEARERFFGVAPGAARAEQVWFRREGPMSFFGAKRVGNGTDGSRGGGCLLEVNPPAPTTIGRSSAFAARRVLDLHQQAWCVIEHSLKPNNTCVTVPKP